MLKSCAWKTLPISIHRSPSNITKKKRNYNTVIGWSCLLRPGISGIIWLLMLHFLALLLFRDKFIWELKGVLRMWMLANGIPVCSLFKPRSGPSLRMGNLLLNKSDVYLLAKS